MKISVTWVTPREYSADLDMAELLSCFTGTAHQAQAQRLLSQIEAGSTLADDDMAKLAVAIGQHPAMLPEDDQHWTSTGESEITHIQRTPAGG
jgi:hypothetical protein